MCAVAGFHTVGVLLMQMGKTIKDQRTTTLSKNNLIYLGPQQSNGSLLMTQCVVRDLLSKRLQFYTSIIILLY